MSVLDDLFEAKEPEQRTAEFCTLHELRELWAEAKQAADRAKLQANARSKDADAAATAEAAEERLTELRERIGRHLIRFTFRSIEREEWDRLKAENRPTERQRTDQRKAGLQPPEWNVDTFAPAIVAAACVKLEGPSGEAEGISREDADRIWSSPRWNESERSELFHTALAAYLSRTQLDGVSLGNV